MNAQTVPEPGQKAPDFKLKGPGGAFYTLSEHLGESPVVLVFYPLAFSAVCSHQLPELARRRVQALDDTRTNLLEVGLEGLASCKKVEIF